MLADTLRQMKSDGVKRAIAFATSAYSSYSSCRQYRENIAAAQAAAGDGAPQVDKLRVFYNHPLFVEANVDHVREALNRVPEGRRASASIAYTAHSIPVSMSESCDYQRQLLEVGRLVSEALGRAPDPLVFQSRSGPASQPWLEPDILGHLREIQRQGATDVVIAPIGFVSDHMEVIYDLDTEARLLCSELDLNMERAATRRYPSKIREYDPRVDRGENGRVFGEAGGWGLFRKSGRVPDGLLPGTGQTLCAKPCIGIASLESFWNVFFIVPA